MPRSDQAWREIRRGIPPPTGVSFGRRRVRTLGFVLVIPAAGLLNALARAGAGGWLALGSAAVLVLPLVAWMFAPDLRHLHGSRAFPTRATVGEEVEFTLTLTNTGRRTTVPVRVDDELPGYATVVVAFPALRPGEESSVTLRRTALRRVSGLAGAITILGYSPVGLLAAKVVHPASTRVVVHPARLPGLRLQPAGERRDDSKLVTSQPVAGLGTELLGLREWRAGESARAVSARATARHGRPLVLEREREVTSRLVVVVGRGSGAGWEQRLAEALDTVLIAAASGRPAVVLGLPPHPPTQVRDAFAAADEAAVLTAAALHAALAQAGPAGALVVVTGQVNPRAVTADLRPAADAMRCRLVVLDG